MRERSSSIKAVWASTIDCMRAIWASGSARSGSNTSAFYQGGARSVVDFRAGRANSYRAGYLSGYHRSLPS
jgi:hypothetical protein